jgi:hypothetical protein
MQTKGKTRKLYSKPQVHQVKLHVGEAVLQACKAEPLDPDGKIPQNCASSGCKKTYGS